MQTMKLCQVRIANTHSGRNLPTTAFGENNGWGGPSDRRACARQIEVIRLGRFTIKRKRNGAGWRIRCPVGCGKSHGEA